MRRWPEADHVEQSLRCLVDRSELEAGCLEIFKRESLGTSSVVRVFAHSVMGHRIDPSW